MTAQLATGPNGPILALGPVGGLAITLAPEQPVVVGDYQYTFLGQREFTGITVRRDPGTIVIWTATGFLLAGLLLTFYVPRRRLWAKISQERVLFRGLGGTSLSIQRELNQIAERAGRQEP